MTRFLLLQVSLLLVYLAYRGVFCEETTGSDQQYGKLSLRDLLSILDSGHDDDLKFLKRSEKAMSDEAKIGLLENLLDSPYEKNPDLIPDEFVKNNQYLWQMFSEQTRKWKFYSKVKKIHLPYFRKSASNSFPKSTNG